MSKELAVEASAAECGVAMSTELEPTEALPFVTIVVPCRNEEKHIRRCLESILANDYPKERMEILVLDGMSEDHTGAIVADYAQRYPQLRLVNNPTRTIPTAMNRGIRQAQGEVVMKVDAHST